MSKTKVLVTSVGAPPGFNAVRALESCADIDLVLADASPYASGLYRFPELKSYLIPFARQEKEYIQSLLEIVRQEKIRVILPCLEDEILVLARYHDFFAGEDVTIPIPDYDTVRRGTDKFEINQIAEALGVPHPKTIEIKKAGDLALDGEIQFPLIVKPKISHGARGYSQIAGKAELESKIAELLPQFGELIVQEFVPGSEGSILLCGLLYDHEHKLKISFQSRSLKTLFVFGGPAVVGEPIEDKRIREWSEKIIRQLGPWQGPVNLEFKVNGKNGIPYLMELNPRLWGYGSLPVFCGLNFPYFAVEVALKKKIEERHEYSMDQVMIRSYEDFAVPRSGLKR